MPRGRLRPPAGSVRTGEVYVPAGWFRAGGDPEALNALPACRLWLDGFVIREAPVTNAEYLEFVNDLVARGDEAGALRAAPGACPHMGASLACARVRGDNLVCPWHGLELGDGAHGRWRPLTAHDDGVLAWVRLARAGDETAAPNLLPILAPRPTTALSGVIRMEANCDPGDILANRLDPWHGAHYHPHSFARLKVLEERDDLLLVRVAYRVFGPLAVEVDATFHCPDPRTIVMTIVGGEGTGSVVETHATPIGPGRTAVIEATLEDPRPILAAQLKRARGELLARLHELRGHRLPVGAQRLQSLGRLPELQPQLRDGPQQRRRRHELIGRKIFLQRLARLAGGRELLALAVQAARRRLIALELAGGRGAGLRLRRTLAVKSGHERRHQRQHRSQRRYLLGHRARCQIWLRFSTQHRDVPHASNPGHRPWA